jgi:hypothetical protein
MIKRVQHIINPPGGWDRCSLYLVDVASKCNNPIWRAVLYTGFCTSLDPNGGYGYIKSAGTDMMSVNDMVYLKFISKIADEHDLRTPDKEFFTPFDVPEIKLQLSMRKHLQ